MPSRQPATRRKDCKPRTSRLSVERRLEHIEKQLDCIHVHLGNIAEGLIALRNQGVRIMAKQQEFAAILASIDAETTRIAAKIEELLSKISAGGMTAEEEAATRDQLQASLDRLKTIGADPENPVPEPVA